MTTRGLQPEHVSCLCLVYYRHVSWAPHRQTSPSSALWIKHLKHLFSLYLLKRRQTIKVYITDQKEAGTYNTRSVYNFSVIHFNWLSILTVNMWPSRRRVHLHADGLQGVVSPFQDFHCKVRHGAILTIPPHVKFGTVLVKGPGHASFCMWDIHVALELQRRTLIYSPLKGCSPQPHTYGAVSSYTERCLLRGRSQNRLNSWADHLTGYCEWPQTNTSSSFSRSDPEASSNQPLRPGSVQGSPPSQCAKNAWPWRHPCQLLLPISWAETPTFLSCRPH